MKRHRCERGFTLLELIVAAGILALIAVFSWRGLDTLIREREAIAASQAVIDVMQRSFARLERDAQFATDVQLDGNGTMRFVSGLSSAEGVTGTTIEYRLVSGALSRSVVGIDRGPLLMIDGIGSLAMEVWLPGPRGGGAWVRAKGMAVEARPPPATPAAGGSAAATTAPSATPATPTAPVTPLPQPPQAGPAAVAAATGVRLSLAFVDGTRIVRSFMVGGG